MNYNSGYNNNQTPQNQFLNQNNFQPFQQQMPQQFFSQPQGALYVLNNLSELNTIPTGLGVSAAISLKDNMLYLKTIQNGNPITLSYRLSMLNGEEGNNSSQTDENSKKIFAILDEYDSRLKKIEEALSNKKKGGTNQWPL